MMGINQTIIVINFHPYLFILIIFIYLILHMTWENHVYYLGVWDRNRAAHTNISEDRNLLLMLLNDFH